MRRLLQIIGKVVLIFLALLLTVAVTFYVIKNEKLPNGITGKKADQIAQKMLDALNNEAFKKTKYFEWSFNNGKHHYKWDKENGKVLVRWDAYAVRLNLNHRAKSIVLKNNKEINDDSKNDIITEATNLFNNDSFWLVAPFKVFDKGTRRSLVSLPDGSTRLLVSYLEGGTTPGDSYLWNIQENGFPKSYKMWTKIIPIGGIEATWDDWQIMESGVFLPASHQLGPIRLKMGLVKAYN